MPKTASDTQKKKTNNQQKPLESYTTKSDGRIMIMFIFSELFLAFSKSSCFVIRNTEPIK